MLFAGGVVIALRVHTSATIAAGLAGILTSLGLTWKGIGGALGGLAGKLEKPLWGAELDTAITDAITLQEARQRRARGAKPPAEAKPTGELAAQGSPNP